MTDTVSSYQGLYINLDRSPERRARIERQLRTLGLEKIYRRFPAVDGAALKLPNGTLRPGEVGAFLSHTRALETALTSGTAVHILEDDALLSEHVRPVVEDAVSSGLFDRFDILFTDTFVSCHIGLLKFLKTRFDATAASPATLVAPPRASAAIMDAAERSACEDASASISGRRAAMAARAAAISAALAMSVFVSTIARAASSWRATSGWRASSRAFARDQPPGADRPALGVVVALEPPERQDAKAWSRRFQPSTTPSRLRPVMKRNGKADSSSESAGITISSG